LGAGIDPGMALNVDHFYLVFWTRFEPTTFRIDPAVVLKEKKFFLIVFLNSIFYKEMFVRNF
jgi:hypothetical protein